MHIAAITVNNYKSFDTGERVELGDGFNVVLGQNNVGKSALLEAINFPTVNSAPHRKRNRSHSYQLSPDSRFEIDICVSGSEIQDSIIANAGLMIPFPIPEMSDPDSYISALFEAEELTFRCYIKGNTIVSVDSFPLEFNYTISNILHVSISDGKPTIRALLNAVSQLPALITWITSSSIFGFKAERFHVGQHPFADSPNLDQNSRNLPVVLNYIQGNRPSLFDQIRSEMNEIFPSVRSISVGPSGNELVVRIWANEDATDITLSSELNASGTGIGQALSILVAASTMRSGTLVIDEINSFLHPLAIKRLLNILRTRYDRHQYVVSSHAIELIRWCDPDSVTLVKKEGENTNIVSISSTDVSHLRATASELGFSVSDVFGAERVLWVEGYTEEECYPLLFREFELDLGSGAAVVALNSTASFTTSKKAEGVLSIYDRVSSVASPFTRGVVVALDREGLSDQALHSIHESHKGRIRLSDRRTFENYLIHTEALAQLLASESGISSINGTTIENWIRSHGSDRKFKSNKVPFINGSFNGEWLKMVDAPNLFNTMFLDITSGKTEYRKRTHGLHLTKFLIEHDARHLEPLLSYLRKVAETVHSL